MEYLLDTRALADNLRITIVGSGGTGGFVAESLCRLLTGRAAQVVLVDHDRVEPHNLLRQNFHQADIGRFKSQALAERLAGDYYRTIGYSTHPFLESNNRNYAASRHSPCLMIGCVDNAQARRAMAQWLPPSGNSWLIDAGNGANWGQVLIGNTNQVTGDNLFDQSVGRIVPAPTLQRPDLLTTVPQTPPDVDCAAALDLTDQDPTINQMMASLVTMTVRRMIAGDCPFMSLYLDMEQGTVLPSYATPENVRAIFDRARKTQTADERQDRD